MVPESHMLLLFNRRNQPGAGSVKDSQSRKSSSQGTSVSNQPLQESQELNAVIHPQTVSSSLALVLPAKPVPPIPVSANDVIFGTRYSSEHGTQTLLSLPVGITPSHSSDLDSLDDDSIFDVETDEDYDSSDNIVITSTPELLIDSHPSVKPAKSVRFADPIETVRYLPYLPLGLDSPVSPECVRSIPINEPPASKKNSYIKAFKIGAFIVLGVVVIGAAGACIYFFAPAAATAFVATKLIAGLALLKTVLAFGLSSKSTLPMLLTAAGIASVAAFTGFGVARVISYLCTDKTELPCCEPQQPKDPKAVIDPCHPPKP